MKAKFYFYARGAVVVALGCLVAACASPQDEFGYAVSTGNVPRAAANNGPNYANMRIWKTPNQYSVPMQYAINQGNRQMAGFLLENGAHRTLNGQNLAYYSAANGRPDMARYFVSRGIGGESDISRGSSALASNRERDRQNAQAAGLIGLAVLGAMMGGGSRGNSGYDVECPACHGSGKDEINTTSDCIRCDGRGHIDSRVIPPFGL